MDASVGVSGGQGGSVDADAPLMEAGVDSLGAVELKLFARRAIEPKQAEKWRTVQVPQPLDPFTVETCEQYGFELYESAQVREDT